MITKQKVIRKLSAILSADVKGYCLLMTRDEASTIQTLKEYRIIMSEIINQHNGRVVDAPGDNIMAEFSSVVNAVQCSVEIQKILKEKNAELPDEKRLEFRIGINIGDVVQDGGSLYGEGVNIAARIEGLAEPGGICISRGAYDHIRNKLGFGYEYLGEHDVKNIKHPVRVYNILTSQEDAGKLVGEKPKPLLKSWVWSAIVVAIIILTLVGYQLFQKITAPEFEPAAIKNMAFPLPEKPSIAVLAFDNMSDDPKQDYFSDGLTKDIITALSKASDMFVIDHNSISTYKGKEVEVNQVAEELGVQYVLEGSVRKSGDRVRITTQLIDSLSGHSLWAERYDKDLKNIFAIQDEITLSIIKELQINLTEGERIRLRSDTKNLEAWICFIKSRAYYKNFKKEEYAKGIKLLERAVELDPEYTSSWAILGLYHYNFYKRDWSNTSELAAVSRKRGIALVEKALEMDEYNIVALNSRAGIYLHERQWDKALAMLEKSITSQPSDSIALSTLAKYKFCLGKFEEAIEHGKKGIRLDPFHSSWQLWYLARAYNWSGQYKEGLEVYERILKLCEKENCTEGTIAAVRTEIAMSYMGLGMEKKARTQIVESLRLHPTLASLENRRKYFSKRFVDQSYVEKIIDTLRKAGAPE
jgi:TolB-like protein/class 3 adenylate cyclase/Tfp pilus assembly protein PilF